MLAALAIAALSAVALTPASADAAVGNGPAGLTIGLTQASSASFGSEMAVSSRFDAAVMADTATHPSGDVSSLAQGAGLALVAEPAPVAPVAPKATVAKQSAPAAPKSSVTVVTTDSESQWSTAHLDSVCTAALATYGVPEADWAWVIAANRNIVYRESRNRPGARSAGDSYAGLHQWSASWGTTEERINGNWSVNRFVQVYAQGGKAKVRQHWASTVGL